MSDRIDFRDLKNIEYGFEKLSRLTQKPVLFVGSGLSKRYLNSPTWLELLEKISEEVGVDKKVLREWSDSNYEELAERLEAIYFTKLNGSELLDGNIKRPFRELISKYLENLTINLDNKREISILKNIHYQKLITTNYDSLLESNIFNIDSDDIYIHNDDLFSSETKNKKLYKIHGSISNPESIIITKADYDQFFEKSKYIYSKLLTIFVESPIVFLGYSVSDRNIKDILSTLTATLSKKDLYKFQERVYIVSYSPDDKPEYFLEKEDLSLSNGLTIKINVFYLRTSYKEFYEVLQNVSLKSDNLEFAVSKNDVVNHFIIPLYEGQHKPTVVMRELLQNSMDACKMANREYDIKISLEKKDDTIFLSVLDNGTGMSIDEIKEYYLKIGKSGKRDKTVKNLVGQFGIGALSMFLISDSIYVQTKKSGEKPISFRMYTDTTKSSKEVQIENSNLEFSEDSYTFVCLRLTKVFGAEINKHNEIKDFLGYFGLSDVVRGGKISLNIGFKEINYLFNTLDLSDFKCISEEPYKIYMYLQNDYSIQNKLLDSLYNHVLYGDMIIKVEYRKHYYNNPYYKRNSRPRPLADIYKIPLIVLEDTEGIEIPLSRESIALPDDIEILVENAYCKQILPTYLKKIDEICDNGGLPRAEHYNGRTMKFGKMNVNWYIKSGKVYIPTSNKEIMYVLSNRVDEVVNKLFYDQKIVIDNHVIENPTNISSSIEYRDIIALSRNYINENLINIKNHNVGFRGDAIKKILRRLGFPCEEFKKLKKASEIKDFVINHTKELSKFFEGHYVNNILWFDENYRSTKMAFAETDYLYISKHKLLKNDNIDILDNVIAEDKYRNIILDKE